MMRSTKLTSLLAGLWLATASLPAVSEAAPDFVDRAEVRAFIGEMADRHGFERGELRTLFKRATPRPEAIRILSQARKEPLPWPKHRAIFLNAARIEGGLEFWARNSDALARAKREYGVPEEVIVAIIGVETRYGANAGTHPMFDTLATLAFDYPPRADFFRGELEQFLLLAREEKVNPRELTGSYAGAMGIPQFIASSYRKYARDFNADGRRDLLHDEVDAIGSVAHYLSAFGWEADHPIATRVSVRDGALHSLPVGNVVPEKSVAELRSLGVIAVDTVPGEWSATIIELETESGPEYWLGFRNFYVITRYNRSIAYAMSVYQLAQALKSARLESASGAIQ
jgi:membrane-bound lytic murein transglycosylase B